MCPSTTPSAKNLAQPARTRGPAWRDTLGDERGQLLLEREVLLDPQRHAGAHGQLAARLQLLVGLEQGVAGPDHRLLHGGEAERPGHVALEVEQALDVLGHGTPRQRALDLGDRALPEEARGASGVGRRRRRAILSVALFTQTVWPPSS